MVGCPECGEPIAKTKGRRYYCENERCSMIYVQRPYRPAIMRVVRESLPSEDEEQIMP